jgi:hypothetical protein
MAASSASVLERDRKSANPTTLPSCDATRKTFASILCLSESVE